MFGYIICGVLLGPSGLNSIKVREYTFRMLFFSFICVKVGRFCTAISLPQLLAQEFIKLHQSNVLLFFSYPNQFLKVQSGC